MPNLHNLHWKVRFLYFSAFPFFLRRIPNSSTFEELPEKYRFEVLCVESIIFFSVVEQVDEFGIRRRKKGNAEKYKKGAFQCKLCKWGRSNKASMKVAGHEENCPSIWIFEDWQPQPLACLKFVKS